MSTTETTQTSEQPEAIPPRSRARDSIAGALRLAWEASPRTMAFVSAVSFATALIPPAVVWLGKRLVDYIAASATTRVTLREVVPTIVGLGLLAGGQRALGRLEGIRQELFAEAVEMNARHRFLEQVARVDLGHFDNSDWHDRVARATRDLNFRPYQLTYTVIGVGSSSITILGMLALLLALHPVLVLLSLLSLVPSLLIQRRINKRRYAFYYGTTPEGRERAYLSELLSLPRYAKEVRAYTLKDHLLGRHQHLANELYGRLVALNRSTERSALITGLISGFALALAYLFVASRGLRGGLTPGAATAVTGAFVSVTAQATSLLNSFIQLDQHAQFLRDYFDFLKIETLLPVAERPTRLPRALDAGIEFDDVHFSYPGGQEQALAGVDLHIRPGELVALVGDNGAGKTTLVKLLLRFYDPQAGSVRVGGVDLRVADPAELRARVGVLFQDFAQYELSVRENVTLGRVDRDATDADVEDALRAARADWLLKRVRGLDAKVGRQFEGGHDLSGGEWQRLALARLMFRDADVWILDEPTSSLDPEAEASIFAELRENLQGRMGIVISHRFSTVRIADRIAVIQDGRVTELGTHGELLALGGRYAHLFELQATGYR